MPVPASVEPPRGVSLPRRLSRSVLLALGPLAIVLAAIAAFSADLIVFGPQTFQRGTGKPVAVTRTFRVTGPLDGYTLHVMNRGVTSAVISLNGREVLGPEDFKRGKDKDDKDREDKGKDDKDKDNDKDKDSKNTDTDKERAGRDDDSDYAPLIERGVTLRAGNNQITVELRSKPGTSLIVEILRANVTAPPSLTITKTHVGNFTQGQPGATYQVIVSNAASSGTTSGTVTVTDTVPAGLALASMAGTGWQCAANSCARSDALSGRGSYPPITVTMSVAGNATSPQMNTVSVTGGGSANASATDSTTIFPNLPALTVAKTHTGNFIQGQQGATYTVIVSNAATAGATSGAVTVSDAVPTGLTLASLAGTGWQCAGNSCSRSDGLLLCPSTGELALSIDACRVVTSPDALRLGTLAASEASEPRSNSRPSGNPSPSLSRVSCALMTEKVLPLDANAPELPTPFVATSTNVPLALGLTLKGSVAVVPVASICGAPKVSAGGTRVGSATNCAPARFAPTRVRLPGGRAASIPRGITEVMIGNASTVKEDAEVAVLDAIDTVMGPDRAPAGTCAMRVFAEAEVTDACTPLKDTLLSAALLANAMPSIVTKVPSPPRDGENPRIVN